MSTIAIYSLKGGVGKTTLAVNLAWCSATLSARRTLLWDLDPQAASSWILSDRMGADQAHAVFAKDVAPAKLTHPTAYPRLDLLAADASLRALDRFLYDLDKKRRLHKLLSGLKTYDRIVLDCPPGLTETADQVMRAADVIVVPVVPSPLSERAYHEVARYLGDTTRLMPVHVMVDRRRRVHADALLRHPDWPVVPMASQIEAVAVKRAPIGSFAPKSAGAEAFAMLWRAVERRLAL